VIGDLAGSLHRQGGVAGGLGRGGGVQSTVNSDELRWIWKAESLPDD
jgi:hypothetical protein